MRFIESPGGRKIAVVSDPGGDLPAPPVISEGLAALSDGRLIVLKSLQGKKEMEDYLCLFFEYMATSGRDVPARVAWVEEKSFGEFLSWVREEDPLPEGEGPSPDALWGDPDISRDVGEGRDSPPESGDDSPEEPEPPVPAALSGKVILFPDGRIAAAEALRENPEFDRFVRRHSMKMESCGKIGGFRISWVSERTLKNLGSGNPVGVREEDPALALADLDLPSLRPGEETPPDSGHGGKLSTTEEGKKDPDEKSGPGPECLSSPSGGTIPDFRAPDDIASMVLLFLDGRFFASREHKTNQHVNYYCRHFVPELWPKIFGGRPVPTPQFVPYEHLRKIRLDHLPEEADASGFRAEGDEARKIMEIIRDAIGKKASDIHLRVERDRTRVLYRVHGWLKPVQTLTRDEGERLARIVYNTMLDSAGRDNMFSDKKPQDGQFRQDYLPRGVFNIREFHAPTGGTGLGTITMVLRLQYGSGTATASAQDIDTLGYGTDHLAKLRFLMGLSYGIVLFSGPMGSGKSTSMASVLSIVLLMNPLEEGRGLHLATLEDPPEYVIPTASQIAVPGGMFSEVLGRIMRFDANILMIGEIRDEATAEKAIEGAMSGHVVYSTVHANDVLSIPRRLDGLKVRKDLLSDPTIFRGMVCQRLVPLLCPDCRVPWREAEKEGLLRPDLKKRLGDVSVPLEGVFFHRSGGCRACDGQGIVGRTIVAEILLPDQEILDMISSGRLTDAWSHFREKLDGRTMMDHALDKVGSGVVDPRDIESRLGWIHKGAFDSGTIRTIVGGLS